MKKYLVGLLSLTPSFAFATDFHNFPKYDENTSYLRSDVVSHGHNLWVSRFKGIHSTQPKVHSLKWAKVQLEDIPEWNAGKLYLLGKSIKYNGRYYVSTTLTPIKIDSQFADKKWVEFTHPAIGYELPNYDRASEVANTLIGVDINQNNIRDDYEVKVIMSSLHEETKQYALNAGMAYDSLMQTSDEQLTYSAETAENILNTLIIAKACKREQAIIHGGDNTWRESDFFNTFDRVREKFKLQNKLAAKLTNTNLSVDINNACGQLNQLIVEAK